MCDRHCLFINKRIFKTPNVIPKSLSPLEREPNFQQKPHSIINSLIDSLSTGNEAKLHFNLNNYSTEADVLAAVQRVKYHPDNTNTTGGLKVARLQVFSNHSYQRRPNIEPIIILITDGEPTRDFDTLDDEVAALTGMGVRIIGLGITNKVSHVYVYVPCIRSHNKIRTRVFRKTT